MDLFLASEILKHGLCVRDFKGVRAWVLDYSSSLKKYSTNKWIRKYISSRAIIANLDEDFLHNQIIDYSTVSPWSLSEPFQKIWHYYSCFIKFIFFFARIVVIILLYKISKNMCRRCWFKDSTHKGICSVPRSVVQKVLKPTALVKRAAPSGMNFTLRKLPGFSGLLASLFSSSKPKWIPH